MNKIRLGISIGDFNGIGLEVVLKTLANKKILDYCTPVIYGSSKIVSYHKNIVGIEDIPYVNLREDAKFRHDKVNIINCWQENVSITIGKPTPDSGKYAAKSLAAAIKALRNNEIDGLVTAPIHKQAMKEAGFPFPGHTEYLAQELGGGKHLMLMVNDNLRIGLVTNHEPIAQVAQKITKQLVADKLRILHETLIMDFGIERPTIAVLGLNPHAGDGGVLGHEEDKMIRPAVIEAKKSKNMLVMALSRPMVFLAQDSIQNLTEYLLCITTKGLFLLKPYPSAMALIILLGFPVSAPLPTTAQQWKLQVKTKLILLLFAKHFFWHLILSASDARISKEKEMLYNVRD